MVGRNEAIVEENGVTKGIMMKLRWDVWNGSSKITKDSWGS
jgi:hypothetical protein